MFFALLLLGLHFPSIQADCARIQEPVESIQRIFTALDSAKIAYSRCLADNDTITVSPLTSWPGMTPKGFCEALSCNFPQSALLERPDIRIFCGPELALDSTEDSRFYVAFIVPTDDGRNIPRALISFTNHETRYMYWNANGSIDITCSEEQ